MAVQIILKNSSIEDKRPNASQLTNGEISLNYNEAGAFLCCTDSSGEVQQVGGVKIDDIAPDAPVKQTLWFKPSTLTLSVYDGDKWLPIAGGGGGGGGGGGDIIQIIGNDGIDADTVAGIVTLDVELAGGDDGLEFKSSKLSATLASATDLGSVKVGDNINVTAGKISVPKATSSTFGVVKLGDGITIEGDGSISIDVPTTTTYRGSCDLNNPPTGQINPDPAEKGDAYINSADAPAVDAGWTGITGSAKIGDLVIFDGAIWDLIPLGGEAPVTSVNGKTGDVVLDYTDVGAASEAQGELADTALQPGDNISELNNDEGYITAAEAPVQSVNGKTGVVVLDAADVGALAPGDNVSLLANDAEYISKGDPVSDLDNDAEYLSKGDDISELNNDVPYLVASDLPPFPDQEPPVIISDTPPTGTDAAEGNLWFNSNDGRTYVYYKDGDSSQWVDASPDSGGAGGTVGDYWLEAGGYLSPKTGTNGVDIGGSNIQLNADGSINAAGDNFKVQSSGQVSVLRDTSVGSGNPKDYILLRGWKDSYADNNQAFHISAGGTAQFAGDVGIGGTYSGGIIDDPAISLNADGTSVFAASGNNVGIKNELGASRGVLEVHGEGFGLTSSLNNNGYMSFKTITGGALQERARITNDGSFLLAGSVPSAPRIVLKGDTGGADFESTVNIGQPTSAVPKIILSSAGIVRAKAIMAGWPDDKLDPMQGSLHVVGQVYVNNIGSGTGSTLKYNTSTGKISYDASSARYKDNIRDSDVGLAELMQLRSVKFEYKNGGATDIGFIAEEVHPIIPEYVSLDEEGQPESVSYDRMVSVLTKALQEATTRIEALEARLDAAGV